MIISARIIAILITAAGIMFLVNPKTAKGLLAFWEKEKRVYTLAVVRVIIGIILLLAASQCMIPWIVFVIGLLPIIGGILILVFGLERSRNIIREWKEKPDDLFRRLGFAPLILGLLLLWAI